MKTTAICLGMGIQKFLWNAAMQYKKTKKHDETSQITKFMDMEKSDPVDVFSLNCWDDYISDEKSFKKAHDFYIKFADLVYDKEKLFGKMR